ncbi:2245_t:CDS:2 [Acaulospora colombiana]|uniref:2245_t:CDS:1 n=1 Tax=Acaulospora colombiana TaxID=27376 RepID=A0ACA9LHM6_9GLOM|nr:2245_t:CDS:2 [Acaulospora colombiana]
MKRRNHNTPPVNRNKYQMYMRQQITIGKLYRKYRKKNQSSRIRNSKHPNKQ